METYDKKAAELIERSYQTPEIVQQRLQTLAALGLKSGESVFDAGCGTGLLLEQEALAVGPQGRAEGIDFSEDMLAHARHRCSGLDQVNLRQGNIESLPFDDADFDAVSCTQILLYINQLQRALGEIYRVLKPRGRLAIIETDWSAAIISSHDQVLTRKILDAWGLAVPNPGLPRRLAPILREQGFHTMRTQAIPLLNANNAEHSFSANMLNNMARTAVKQKLITADESRAWLDGIGDIISKGDYFFCVNRFLVVANK